MYDSMTRLLRLGVSPSIAFAPVPRHWLLLMYYNSLAEFYLEHRERKRVYREREGGMGSFGGDVAGKKIMWLYPKVLGINPSERWGHSACYASGIVYVFGGCCGGLHFGDVLTFNLSTMSWNTLATTGHGPGPRDSHSAILVGHKMIVFGGTNGSKKVNDLHILDLASKEWTRPECKGNPPSPRESHTATLVGDNKLVIFGGSGEGEANYLNDLHVLDLKTMRWTSPAMKGDIPVPRDSHSSVAVGNKLFVYGGDCGDRYHGDVDVLDLGTLVWSRLALQGLSPGVRAGHAAVNIGRKLYVIGGVGDKHYYNDVWILDMDTCLWTQLEIRGQQPQGRFSHTAIVTDSDIVIYGGCGEDERPLNELLVLQLGQEHPNGRYNISLCKIFGNHRNNGKKRLYGESEEYTKALFLGNNAMDTHKNDPEPKNSSQTASDILHPKRRRIRNLEVLELESEQEEHSLSLSQHSSPSQSDQEHAPAQRAADSIAASRGFPLFRHKNYSPPNCQCRSPTSNRVNPRNIDQVPSRDLQFFGEEQNLDWGYAGMHEARVQTLPEAGGYQNLIGAEVSGRIDGAFDSGILMTATINGKVFRGVLFAPGPGFASRGIDLSQNRLSGLGDIAVALKDTNPNPSDPSLLKCSKREMNCPFPESNQSLQGTRMTRTGSGFRRGPLSGREDKARSDLQGVVLTLGGPGNRHGEL